MLLLAPSLWSPVPFEADELLTAFLELEATVL